MRKKVENSAIRGIRSVEIEMSDPVRAADFFARVWHLDLVKTQDGSHYFRGTGPYHHIVAVHRARANFGVRRIVFDAVSKQRLIALYQVLKDAGFARSEPQPCHQPGGGFGFRFTDPEGRNFAVVCDVSDHANGSDRPGYPRKIVHINLNAAELPKTNLFFQEMLGLELIDETPVLSFFHAASTDHGAVVTCGSGAATINHVAFEMSDWESVMRGAGRMRDAGFPLEWGIGRHSAGNNMFGYFAGPEEFPLEYTAEVAQIDNSYVPQGPDYWRFPPGRLDQWGITAPHSLRWKRIQQLYHFVSDEAAPL